MPTFKLPLSGDVVQSINPFTAFMTGGQFGLVNINLGQSSEPKVEEEVLSDVASYGKQLGRIGDALMGQNAGLEACGRPDRDCGIGGHIGRRRAARLGCIRAHRRGVLDHGVDAVRAVVVRRRRRPVLARLPMGRGERAGRILARADLAIHH